MNNDELIEYAIRTSKVIKEEIKPKLLDYFYQKQERIEYLERSNNRREDTIIEQRQEISDLEDNWNKLKKYIKTEIPEDAFIDTEWFVSILDKMQELEGSNE